MKYQRNVTTVIYRNFIDIYYLNPYFSLTLKLRDVNLKDQKFTTKRQIYFILTQILKRSRYVAAAFDVRNSSECSQLRENAFKLFAKPDLADVALQKIVSSSWRRSSQVVSLSAGFENFSNCHAIL